MFNSKKHKCLKNLKVEDKWKKRYVWERKCDGRNHRKINFPLETNSNIYNF